MTDTIGELLIENDMADEVALRGFLHQLQDTATSVRPMPSPELAALLVSTPRRSHGHRRRTIITTVVVVGTLAAGATTAAANPEVRNATGRAIQAVVGVLIPGKPTVSSTISSEPSAPKPAPKSTETSSAGHPGSADHPGATNHPDPSDHPGSSGSKGNSGSNAKSDAPHPNSGASGQPATSPHGGTAPKP